MGVWVPKLQLTPGESLSWRVGANWVDHRGMARGGRLALTSEALVFQPHRVDAATGASSWRVPLTDIADADVAPIDRSASFSGGMRRRLRVTLSTGAVILLVANKCERLAQQISSAAASAPSSPPPPTPRP